MSVLAVGCRVQRRGSRGTVRYIGPVHGHEETTWIGIEWDDPTRGKHNGSVHGVKYFDCRHPTCASFIKAEKLKDAGRRSLLEASKARLVENENQSSGVTHLTTRRPEQGANFREMEERDVVGFTGNIMTLSGMGVHSAGDPVAIRQFFPRLRVMDLRESLFSQPLEIVQLLTGLAHLHELDLSDNRFYWDDEALSRFLQRIEQASSSAAFPLRVLVLNKCVLPWAVIATLCSACKSLEELRVHSSGLRDVSLDLSVKQNQFLTKLPMSLRLVDINGNSVQWRDIVSVFGQLPLLSTLYAGDNEISTVQLEQAETVDVTSEKSSSLFPSLCTLSLTSNPIRHWKSINELSKLKALHNLHLLHIPLSQAKQNENVQTSDSMEFRDAVIARLGCLQTLDGTTITTDERVYAEKKYLNLSLAVGKARYFDEQFFADYPRIRELCARYDIELDVSQRNPSLSTATHMRCRLLRDDLAHFRLTLRDEAGSKEIRVISVELPVSLPVNKIKSAVRRMFSRSLHSSDFHLDLVATEDANMRHTHQLCDSARDMTYYGFSGGSLISIDVRPTGLS